MNDEIKVNDYVRTKDGHTFKVKKIYCDYVCDEDVNDLVYAFEFGYKISEIIKHSPNIIDLIEENDYVNGCLVVEKPYECFDEILIPLDTKCAWGWGVGQMPISKIKTIVTKEQFEKIMYRVEE